MSVTIVSMTDNNKLNETNQTATSNFDLSYSNKTIFNDVPTFDWNEKLQVIIFNLSMFSFLFNSLTVTHSFFLKGSCFRFTVLFVYFCSDVIW